MGFVQAPWAGARTGQPHLGPVSVLYGLSGRGLELSGISFIWAKWAWAGTAHPCLVPIWAMHGQSGYMAQN